MHSEAEQIEIQRAQLEMENATGRAAERIRPRKRDEDGLVQHLCEAAIENVELLRRQSGKNVAQRNPAVEQVRNAAQQIAKQSTALNRCNSKADTARVDVQPKERKMDWAEREVEDGARSSSWNCAWVSVIGDWNGVEPTSPLATSCPFAIVTLVMSTGRTLKGTRIAMQ